MLIYLFMGETHKHMKAYPSFDLIPFLILENALKYTLDDNEINGDFEEKDNSLNAVFFVKRIKAQADLQFVKIFGD